MAEYSNKDGHPCAATSPDGLSAASVAGKQEFVRRRCDELTRFEEEPGLFGVKLIDGEAGSRSVALLRGWLEPGARHSPHIHDCEEAVVFLSGQGVVTIKNSRMEVGPGDTLWIPPNTVHGTENTQTCEALHFIAAFSDSLVSSNQASNGERSGRRHPARNPAANRAWWAMRKIIRLALPVRLISSLYRGGK